MICEVPPLESFIAELLPALKPRATHATWDWIRRHGRMPDGVPFDGDRIPWCEGVCDALDAPETRQVVLQWGTRLGKTTIGLQWMAKVAATQPRAGLFATSTQSLAKRTVRNKIYPVLSAISATNRLLPDPRWWTLEEIRLSNCPWAVAWSGSETQLADLSAFYGLANELDKWSLNERLEGSAGEGDPLDQFEERFKEFSNYKMLLECSPSTKRHSRIEKKLLASDNRRFWVACPKCGERQVLRLGSDDPLNGGILFDRDSDGSCNPAKARESARYVCSRCKGEIHDDQRPRMMRNGVWAPEGCHVSKSGRIVGTPRRGPRIAGFQLSSLYSLQLRWGDIAERFVQSIGHLSSLRVFINGWLAETWEPHRAKSEPEEVGERLTSEKVECGVIPAWATWLFGGIDRQEEHFVWIALAVGPGEREHLVEHGICETFDEAKSLLITRQFVHAGGATLVPAMTFIDCGFQTKEVYSFCQQFRGTPYRVCPCKGANTDCGGEPYEIKLIGLSEGNTVKTKKILARIGRGLTRVRVNPFYYEPITQEQLDSKAPGQPGSLGLHVECRHDTDVLKQLCNGCESSEPSKMDPDRHLWIKREEGQPNDIRDAKKYARCAADYRFKQNWKLAETRQPAIGESAARPAAAEQTETRGRRERFRPQSLRRGGRR